MLTYVILALNPVDTAVIEAESAEAALDKYELPEELKGMDIFVTAMPEDEFPGFGEPDAKEGCNCGICGCK